MRLMSCAGRPARVAALCLVIWVASPARSGAADASAVGRMLEEPPRYGVYYDRYEPAFYTGFAPRTLDPQRIHIHLGRGDQLRVTVVLADDVLREYARDLLARDRTYRALVDSGRLVLTQNRGFEEFERTISEAHVERLPCTGRVTCAVNFSCARPKLIRALNAESGSARTASRGPLRLRSRPLASRTTESRQSNVCS